jgi:hypothetical protein
LSEASVEDRRAGGKKSERSPEVKGNTLRVYLFLLKYGPCELREVQRGLDLSTPSLASYHLDKLIAVGYASRDQNGRYVASKDVPGDVIDGFTRVGARLVPQLFFVAILFTSLVGYFAFMSLHSAAYVPFLVASSLALVAGVWYETLRVWRSLSGRS